MFHDRAGGAGRRRCGYIGMVLFAHWTATDRGVFGTCWGLFALVWAAGIAYNATRSPHVRVIGHSQSWLAAALTLLLVWLVPGSVWESLTLISEPLKVFGYVVLPAATLFTIWARIVLGLMWAGTPVLRERHQLRTDGPYSVTRHPIYTGFAGMTFASMLISGFGAWTLCLVGCVVFVEVRIHDEERLMRDAFGAEYDGYRRRVPQLIPRPGRVLRASGP